MEEARSDIWLMSHDTTFLYLANSLARLFCFALPSSSSRSSFGTVGFCRLIEVAVQHDLVSVGFTEEEQGTELIDLRLVSPFQTHGWSVCAAGDHLSALVSPVLTFNVPPDTKRLLGPHILTCFNCQYSGTLQKL